MVYCIDHAFRSRLDVFCVLYNYSILKRIQEVTNSVSSNCFGIPQLDMLGTLTLDLPIQKVIIFALPNQLVQLQLAELTIAYTRPIARPFQ